jgi:hypothetical protein
LTRYFASVEMDQYLKLFDFELWRISSGVLSVASGWGEWGMRWVRVVAACVSLSVVVGGCDPTLESQYFREGVGTDLNGANLSDSTVLLNEYVDFVCGQAGLVKSDLSGVPFSCNDRQLTSSEWMIFVQAGMNDIDRRCDS